MRLYKILRVTAWVLVILMPISLLSGFYMAKNFLVPWADYATMAKIHGFIVLLALLPSLYLHSLTGILVSMMRYPALNKKWLKAVIVFIWTAMLALMVFFLFAQAPAVQTPVKQTSTQDAQTTSEMQTQTASVKKFTLAEIATHDTIDDCWLLIDGKVYDVTANIGKHPGGEKNITDNCGKEATSAFQNKEPGIPHSPNANDMLKDLLIGELSS